VVHGILAKRMMAVEQKIWGKSGKLDTGRLRNPEE
jgi:hypothetical protein